MTKLEKGRAQIALFLIAYLIISCLIGLTAIEGFKPEPVSYNVIIAIYVGINVIAALCVYVYTRKRLMMAGASDGSYSLMSEEERKEEEEKKRRMIEKQQIQAKAEQERKAIAEKVSEIADPIADEIFPENYFDQLLINISKALSIVQGVAYTLNRAEGKYQIISTYAYYTTDTSRKFENGEGITGQVAKDQRILLLNNVPDNYIRIVSGLGQSSPRNLIVIPIVYDDETVAVLELASFETPTLNLKEFFKDFNGKVSSKIADILK